MEKSSCPNVDLVYNEAQKAIHRNSNIDYGDLEKKCTKGTNSIQNSYKCECFFPSLALVGEHVYNSTQSYQSLKILNKMQFRNEPT